MQPDTIYWKQLATFAYGSYLEKGCGAVQIKEIFSQQFSPANLNKYFQYMPYNADDDKFPVEMAEMVSSYKPEK